MTRQARGDFAGGLILAMRGLVLVAADAALWHWPVGPGIVATLLAAVAVPLFFVAALAFIVASAAWRNAAFRTLFDRRHWQGSRIRSVLLGVPFLAGFFAVSAAMFVGIGRIFT